MSGGRYHRYRQSQNTFDSSDESSSSEDTCPLHSAKPVSDREDEATSAAATTSTEPENMKAPITPISTCRYSEDIKEEKEFGETQASLEKQFVNYSVWPDTRPTHHGNPFDVETDKDELTTSVRSSAQPKYVKPSRDVITISSYSEHFLDKEDESLERPTSSERWYPTRDRDLSSSPGILVQGSWRQKSNPNSERCEHSGSSESNISMSVGAQQGHDENRAVRDLQSYAIHKPQETMSTIKNCLKVAEETKDAAGETMALLHVQGEQIQRTHEIVVKVDQHLTVAEKILGSLGGIFSRKWKPKLMGTITGPLDTGGENFQRNTYDETERTALGLNTNGSMKSSNFSSSTGRFQEHHQEEVGPLKQEDALMDLSNVLGQLKDMSLQMNSEISRQNEGITYLDADVRELNYRVKGANDRGRQLLRR